MFKLAAAAAYWWPVTAHIPSTEKPGELEPVAFEAEYRFLSNAQHDALLAEVKEKGLTDAQVVPRIVSNFRGVEDEHGADLPYSDAALERIADVSGIDSALVRGYFESRAEAAQKNSPRLPASGPEAASPSTKAH